MELLAPVKDSTVTPTHIYQYRDVNELWYVNFRFAEMAEYIQDALTPNLRGEDRIKKYVRFIKELG